MRYDLDAHYELVDDIDVSDADTWFEGNGFEPIGDNQTGFGGHFEGKEHTISSLTIDRPTSADVAVFGGLDDGIVRNVTVTDLDITGNDRVGGLVAGLEAGTLERVAATGTVTGESQVGGLTGSVGLEGAVTHSNASVDVSGTEVGGLAGNNTGTVQKSHARGSVTGGEDAGGLVGFNDGLINRTYAAGEVDGSGTGGLVAVNNATVSDSYWDANTTDRKTSDGGTARTTEQLTGTSPMATTSLNFTSTWISTENYPELRWQVHDSETGAEFIVMVDNTTEPVVTEDQLLINATVENIGDETAEQTIELLDFDYQVVDDWTVSLEPGADASNSFEWDTTPDDTGTDIVTVLSEDDSATESVTILEEATYSVNITDYDEEVEPETAVTLTATVENMGGTEDSETVHLLIDDSQVDEQGIELAGGQSETVELTWDGGESGTYDATVSTGDDDETVSLTVEAEDDDEETDDDETDTGTGVGPGDDEEPEDPAPFSVSNLSVPSTVAVDELVEVSADVTNDGNETVNGTVALETNTTAGTVEQRTVTLEPEETKWLTFGLPVDHGDAPVVNTSVNTAVDAVWSTAAVVRNGSLNVTVRNDRAAPLEDSMIELEALDLTGMDEPPTETVSTDDEGDVRWTDLAAGEYRVTAMASDYRTESTETTISVGETANMERTLVPEPRPLQGEAKDAEGEPAEGATVELVDEETNEVVETTTTDETGQFEFTSPAPASYSVQSADGEDTIEVVTTGRIEALVTDQTGTPVADADVEIIGQNVPTITDDGLPSWQLETDEVGQGTVADLEVGSYLVTATLPGYEEDTATVETEPGATTEASLELVAKPGDVTGTVVAADDASAVANATVVLREDGEDLATVSTNETGRFAFEALDATEYSLVVEADGYQEETQVVSVMAAKSVQTDPVELEPVDTDELEETDDADPDDDEGLFESWWLLALLLAIAAVAAVLVYQRRGRAE